MSENQVIGDLQVCSIKASEICIKTHIVETNFKIQRVSRTVLPYKSTLFSAGYDLSSTVETKVPAQGKTLVPTGLITANPKGSLARIAPRSGLAIKYSICVGEDVIFDCSGHIDVLLYNHSDVDFKVNPGDRIAQLILEEIMISDELETPLSPSLFKVKKHSSNAILPYRASHLSNCFDISSSMEIKVPARGKALVPVDLNFVIPEGTYARIASKFGLASKYGIHVGAGVVDSDYRGLVGVVLFNHSNVDFVVKFGDSIAQVVIQKIMMTQVVEVDDLDSTICGSGGFESIKCPKLESAVEVKVPARGMAVVPTGISITTPEGSYARIVPISELGLKSSICIGAGVIDAKCSRPIDVVLFNHSDVDFEVMPGDHIAQMIIYKIMVPEVVEIDHLDPTVRGSGGFGSTGV